MKNEKTIGHFYYDFNTQTGHYITHKTYLENEALAIKATWVNFLNATQEWYGDITKRETPEKFIERMQKTFDLKYKEVIPLTGAIARDGDR